MDLSEKLVTTRLISATVSPDDVRQMAKLAVRTNAKVNANDKIVSEEATIGSDGVVTVTVAIEVATPVADALGASPVDAAPVAAPISAPILSVLPPV